MKNASLTSTLFFRTAPTIFVTILIIGMMAFSSATSQIQHAYDAQLISSANMMWLVVEDDLNAAGSDAFRRIRKIDLALSNQRGLNKFASEYADDRMFRVWKSRKLVMVSDAALGVDVPLQKPGFSDVTYKNERWRIYNLPIPQTRIVIEAGEKIILRQSLVEHILFDLATPLILLIPLVTVLIWAGIRSGLGTIRALIEQIRRRSSDDLSPLILDEVPGDLAPLGMSINQLLSKLTHSFAAERRFAENAAHHLRTPLAALKLQFQLLTQVSDEAARAALLADINNALDRSARLVSQLLTSARVSHQPIAQTTLSWRQMWITMIEELAPLAAQKRIALSFDSPDDAPVMADETLLRLITGNLLENAIKYTPSGGAVNITLTTDADMQRCEIRDTGPGIPEAERPLVFERFYRIGTPKTEGTGLGLAIVAESLARLSGRIELSAPAEGPGLLLILSLPRAAAE